MKILFNTYYHAFQNPGGGEVVLKKTREALIRNGVHVDLFDLWSTKISDYDIVHNFSVLNSNTFDGLKAYAGKLVVTPVMWPKVSPALVFKERIKKWSNTLIGHNSSEVNFHQALASVDMFFPTTMMEWERICLRYDLKAPHQIIYNGVDLPPKPGGTFSDVFKVQDYVLFVGRISPLKNVHSIIEAALISGNKIVIIGKADLIDIDYEKNLRSKYSNNSNVQFIGPLDNNSPLLNDAYYEAKCLVVASAFETCSLTGLEAGVRGTPVLMTDRGATKEVYRDKVFYINPESTEDIAEKINTPFSQQAKDQLKQFISESYNWDKIAKILSSKYTGILKK